MMAGQAETKCIEKTLMSELNTKNTLISLSVLVKDLEVLLVSWDEVAKQKLLCYNLSLQCWLSLKWS